MRIERWTKEKTEDNASIWDESSTGKEGRGRSLGVGFSLGAWHQGGFRTGRAGEGGGAWAGAELGPGGGLTPSRGPMIEDWGPVALESPAGARATNATPSL